MVSMFYIDYLFPLYDKFDPNNGFIGFDPDPWKRHYIPWYPLFFRSRRGAIFFPRRGEGWYMRDDALAAVKWLMRFAAVPNWRKDGSPVSNIWELKQVHFRIKNAWIFEPKNPDEKPFHGPFNEIYRQRLEYKRAVPYDAREKFYKLPPNSIYGKMAQRIGGIETSSGYKPPPTANPYYAAAITSNCRARLVEAGLKNPHSIVAFMTDGIISTRKLEALPNVVNEGDKSELGDWEYIKVTQGTFIQAGVYDMRKAGKRQTKTRGMDPKRITSSDENAGELLVYEYLKAIARPYDPEEPNMIFLHTRDLVTIGQALMACENKREMWKAGLAGRWAPPIESGNARVRAIDLDMQSIGLKRQWIPNREDDWQSRRRTDGSIRLANRCVTLIPTIPADNPEPPGTPSAIYKVDWIDPDLGDAIDDSDEQGAIYEGM